MNNVVNLLWAELRDGREFYVVTLSQTEILNADMRIVSTRRITSLEEEFLIREYLSWRFNIYWPDYEDNTILRYNPEVLKAFWMSFDEMRSDLRESFEAGRVLAGGRNRKVKFYHCIYGY